MNKTKCENIIKEYVYFPSYVSMENTDKAQDNRPQFFVYILPAFSSLQSLLGLHSVCDETYLNSSRQDVKNMNYRQLNCPQ